MFREGLSSGGRDGGGAHIDASESNASGRVVIPDAEFLFGAHFKKAGADLVLVGQDGHKLVVTGYFDHDHPPDLVTPGGAGLSAEVVAHLAVPETPGQYAQAGAPAGAPVIGRVERLAGSVTVQHANGVVEELKVGDSIRQGDVIETHDGSQVGISLADGTAFNMGADARMVLSELVYNAGATSGNSALFSLVKGGITFVAGQVAKTGDMRVETPVATMGIRGTTVNTNIVTDINGNAVSVSYSLMTDPDGHVGSFQIIDRTTGAIIGTITSTDSTFTVTPTANLGVLAQQTQKSPAEVAQELSVAQALFPIYLANPANFGNQNVAPQNVQPQSPGDSHGSPGLPGGGSTQPLPDPHSGYIPMPDNGGGNSGGGGNHNGPIQITTDSNGDIHVVFTPEQNLPPSVFASQPNHHLKEAAPGNPGVSSATAHIVKVDLNGNSTVTYDIAALVAAGWCAGAAAGTYVKHGQYGSATLNTADNTLTYTLDNTLANPLTGNDHPVESFVVPVIDNGGLTASTTVDFTVDGTNDPPVFVTTSPFQFVAENHHFVTHLSAYVPGEQGQGQFSFEIVGGADADLFAIDSHGNLVFKHAPDYEHPTDSNHNNVYAVEVRASETMQTDNGSIVVDTGTKTIYVTVGNVNEAPQLSPSHGSVSYVVGDGPQKLLPDGFVTDPDRPHDFAGGSLSVTLHDSHSFQFHGGYSGDQIVLEGHDIYISPFGQSVWVDGVDIGRVSDGHLGTDHLKITFNSHATEARVDKLLDALAFDTSSHHPHSGDRTATITFNDGGNDGVGHSLSDTTTVAIHVDQPPSIGTDHLSLGGQDDNVLFGLSVADPDAGWTGHLTVTASAEHGSLSLAEGCGPGQPGTNGDIQLDGTLWQINHELARGVAYTPGDSQAGADKVTLHVDDHHGGTDTVNFIFTVSGNGAPARLEGTSGKDVILSGSGNDVMTGHGGADTFVFGANFGHDTVTDFKPGTDAIAFDSSVFCNAQQVLCATQDDGCGNAVIHAGCDTVTLQGVSKAQLVSHTDDFHFLTGSGPGM